MKRTVTEVISLMCAALALASLSSSCEGLETVTGSPIKFNAKVSESGIPDTKASYAEAGSTATSQSINWEQGDSITVYCAQCEGTKVVDYVVCEATNSSAKIDNTGAHGLIWGTGTHTFYAVSPSVNVNGTTASITGKDITGSIPLRQGCKSVTGTDAKVVAPDMKNMFMVSKSSISANTKRDPVFLDFYPLSTALEFTITNKFTKHNSDMQIQSISLKSDSHALCGGFAVDMDLTGLYNRPKTTLASGVVIADCDSVAIDFGSSPVRVDFEKTINFTFFLNPGNATEVDDLTFIIKGINLTDSSSFVRSARLQKSDGTGVKFETHKKTRISGLMVPEAVEWDIKGELSIAEWTSEINSGVTLNEE